MTLNDSEDASIGRLPALLFPLDARLNFPSGESHSKSPSVDPSVRPAFDFSPFSSRFRVSTPVEMTLLAGVSANHNPTNKANKPTMRPRRWAVGVGRMAAVMVVAAVVVAVVVVSLGMILCVHTILFKIRFGLMNSITIFSAISSNHLSPSFRYKI